MDSAACLFLLLLMPSVLLAEGKPSDDPGHVELSSPPLSSDIDTVLRQMSATLAELNVKIQNLEEQNQVSKVAFSANLQISSEKDYGPNNSPHTLVYKHVSSNFGNAYNSNTGIFTAPVRGVYHFEVHIYSLFGESRPQAEVLLMKNQERIFDAFQNQSSGSGSASNVVKLLLEVGDVVYVVLPANRQLYDNEYHHNTFSGHLLFTV